MGEMESLGLSPAVAAAAVIGALEWEMRHGGRRGRCGMEMRSRCGFYWVRRGGEGPVGSLGSMPSMAAVTRAHGTGLGRLRLGERW